MEWKKELPYFWSEWFKWNKKGKTSNVFIESYESLQSDNSMYLDFNLNGMNEH